MSGLTYEQKEKIERQNQMFAEKCDEKELPMTEDESSKDYSKMESLDLGDHANYKTKIIQKRWE